MYYMNYTSRMVAAAHDRQCLQRDAHFVGMSLIAMIVAMYGLSYTLSYVLTVTRLDITLSAIQWEWANILLYVLTMAPPVAITAVVCKQPIRPLSDHRPLHPLSFVCLVCIGLAVCIFANFVANYIVDFLSLFGIGVPNLSDGMEATADSILINLLSTAILPGIFEEMVFRGYILQALRRYGDGFAVVVSSVLFGLVHVNLLQIPFALIVGLICGYVVVQTRNIWVAVVIHTLNNATSVILNAVGHSLTDGVYIQVYLTVSLILVVLGAICFVGLKAADSPLLDRPSGGWTSLSPAEKRSALFTSPAFLVAVILLAMITLFKTLDYSGI